MVIPSAQLSLTAGNKNERVNSNKSTTTNGSSNSTMVTCKVPKFLRSLYAILQTEDPNVIAWVQNHELKPNRVTAFHILDMQRFEKQILPKYFKHQKFASFQRQLNNFGFRKWTKTQSSGVCTFSHNSFPPDPSLTGVMRASVRDHWRQKSPATAGLPVNGAAPRRRVGNGITRNDRKLKETSSRRRAMNVHVSTGIATDMFPEMYKSPINATNAGSTMDNFQRIHTPSHQPPLKKLARPLQELNGLEAFCDDSYKQFILPPLQPHHLTTPNHARYPYENVEATVSFGGFHRTPGNMDNVVKPMDYHEKMKMEMHHHQQPQTAATMSGVAFMEPWMWESHPSSSGFELGAFPLEFDWHDGVNVANNSNKDALCHQQDRAVPSGAEEFGLENLLFVE